MPTYMLFPIPYTLAGILYVEENHYHCLCNLWSKEEVFVGKYCNLNRNTYQLWHYKQLRWRYSWAEHRHRWISLNRWCAKPYCPHLIGQLHWLKHYGQKRSYQQMVNTMLINLIISLHFLDIILYLKLYFPIPSWWFSKFNVLLFGSRKSWSPSVSGLFGVWSTTFSERFSYVTENYVFFSGC